MENHVVKLIKVCQKSFGFSLLELLIVIVILGLLATIAIPQYQQQVVKARRSDGKIALLDLAGRMERYYAEKQTFVGATIGAGGTISTTNTSPDGYYTLSVGTPSATAFSLTATPTGSQLTDDTLCGTLGLNQLGTKTVTGSGTVAQCW